MSELDRYAPDYAACGHHDRRRRRAILRTIACRFDGEQIAEICAFAAREGVSFASAVRTLVERGLDGDGGAE